MFKKLNACDYYIAVWALYNLQGVLYTPGIINRLLQIIMILWAGIITIKCLNSAIKIPFLKIALYLVLMYCIYGGWIIIFGNFQNKFGWAPPVYLYLQNSLNSILPIYLFFYYTKKGLVNFNRILKYSILFIIVSIIMFYKNKYFLLNAEKDIEEITNNMGYLFVVIIPLIYFFYKRPILQYVLLSIVSVFILIGMKRGAMLIGGLSIIYFLYSSFRSAKLLKKIIIFLLSITLIAGVIYYTSYLMQTSDHFIKRLEQTNEGNSSGRDIIFATCWNTFINETNIFYLLFGHGANATIGITGNYAHQDWLETLINNGILGGFILLSFFIVLLKTIYKQRRRFPLYMYYSFFLVLLITFAKTIFSMSIQDLHISQTLLLGYFTYWSTRPKGELNVIINK